MGPKMTAHDNSITSLCKHILDPLLIMVNLYAWCSILGYHFSDQYFTLMVLSVFISQVVGQHIDPYRTWSSGDTLKYARDLVSVWGVTSIVLLALAKSIQPAAGFDKWILLMWLTSTPIILFVKHRAERYLVSQLNKHRKRSAVILAINDPAIAVGNFFINQPCFPVDIHGYFDDRSSERWPMRPAHPVLGKMEDLVKYVKEKKINIIFISQPLSGQPRLLKLTDELQDTTASIYCLPHIQGLQATPPRLENFGGVPAIAICETPFLGINGTIKRWTDLLLGSFFFLTLLPLMLVIAVAVRVTSPGPVLFRQRRYGLYGEPITVYKFRSMTVADDGPTIVQAKRDDQRVTRIGSFLRRSSLDELPQLINVLQGHMSIVGPRPHAVAHNEEYRKVIKGYMLRHKIKPGMTGWAQVHGFRGETPTIDKMEARVRYDLEYFRNWSIWLDLWIIIKTIKVVFSRDNAY
jgi:putative colanic acid biosynthesis UDP-glucose lipid carrier transferase